MVGKMFYFSKKEIKEKAATVTLCLIWVEYIGWVGYVGRVIVPYTTLYENRSVHDCSPLKCNK